MGSVQKQETKQGLATKQIPGVFGTPESARIARMAESLIGQRQESPLQGLLARTLSGGVSPSETALTSAVANIAGVAPGSLQSVLAPSLQQTRGTGISSLLQALGTQGRAGEARAQTLQGLLELAGLAMPQVVAGQKIKGIAEPDVSGGLLYGTGANLLDIAGVEGAKPRI